MKKRQRKRHGSVQGKRLARYKQSRQNNAPKARREWRGPLPTPEQLSPAEQREKDRRESAERQMEDMMP